MLKPSLLTNVITDPGTIRFNIGHAIIDEREPEQKRHRLFSNVPAPDVRPPDSVVSVALQSVYLSVDILETSPRRRLVVRRSNPSPSRQEAFNAEYEDNAINLFDPDSTEGPPHFNALDTTVSAPTKKRKRSVTGMSPDDPQLPDRALSQTDDTECPRSGSPARLPHQGDSVARQHLP